MKHYQSEERKGVAQEGEWVDQDLAVKADTPLIDSATGKKLIVRLFDFNWNKGKKPHGAENNRQQIFNAHANFLIETMCGI